MTRPAFSDRVDINHSRPGANFCPFAPAEELQPGCRGKVGTCQFPGNHEHDGNSSKSLLLCLLENDLFLVIEYFIELQHSTAVAEITLYEKICRLVLHQLDVCLIKIELFNVL